MPADNFDDKFNSLTPRTQKVVLKSWAKDFSEIVFPAINEERFAVLYSDQLFSRMLRELAQEEADGSLKTKPKTDISSNSLQNPSDPDATFRRKAGKDHKGYVGNILETVGENGCSQITRFAEEKNVIKKIEDELLPLYPNVVGLGCEKLLPERLFEGISGEKVVILQDNDGFDDMISTLVEKSKPILKRLKKRTRLYGDACKRLRLRHAEAGCGHHPPSLLHGPWHALRSGHGAGD